MYGMDKKEMNVMDIEKLNKAFPHLKEKFESLNKIKCKLEESLQILKNYLKQKKG
jgi:hypothetical protein